MLLSGFALSLFSFVNPFAFSGLHFAFLFYFRKEKNKAVLYS